MTAYYNEIDPYCVEWLRNLIAAGLIPPGDVDSRSIADVRPDDIAGYAQCHFFAGLGGWGYAARLAGWPDDRPLWTGSCPCQPFSVAGKRGGFDDERHMWPEWFRLIAQCRPAVVFGEQVASAADWLGLVRSDLATVGYAMGGLPIEAACAGAWQLRDRFFFVADHDQQCAGEGLQRVGQFAGPGRHAEAAARAVAGRDGAGLEKHRVEQDRLQCAAAQRERDGAMGGAVGFGWGERWTQDEVFERFGSAAAVASVGDCQVIRCPDGKWRPLPPSRVRWLGNGIPARVAKLRALGNAIVPQVAAEVLAAYLEGAQEAAELEALLG